MNKRAVEAHLSVRRPANVDRRPVQRGRYRTAAGFTTNISPHRAVERLREHVVDAAAICLFGAALLPGLALVLFSYRRRF